MFARVKSLIKRKKAQALEMTVEKELQQEQQSPAPPAQGNAAATRQVKEAAAAPATTKNTQVAAEKYIEHERQRKQQLPVYPGLERFEIIEKLGDGAFSIVYKAKDTVTGQDVAIKVVRKHELDENGRAQHLHPNMKKKPRATERANVLKEVQIMQTARHKNLVQLIHFSESKDYYFLVMELCRGGELFHRIVKLTYFSEDLARHVIVQVAQGIRHLHEECGVVHRDIKPENILFDPIPIIPSKKPVNIFDEDKEDEGIFQPGIGGGGVGQVKIADFGLSKVIWDNSTLTPCGTVGYTAPEIVRDQKYSKAVDMWALGCVLYTMLCGFPPFYDESIKALTDKVARGQYTFLSPWWDPISDAAKDLITHLLCVDPDKRYTVDEFLNHPWVTQKKQEHRRYPTFPSPPVVNLDLETPSRRKDVFSPGVASIKEILDITYAVQRMGEENKAKKRGLSGVVEEDDGDEDGEALVWAAENKYQEKTQQQQQAAPSSMHARKARHHQHQPFELNMNKATLLNNRRKVAAKN